jgi:hypothetical protein
MTAPGSAQDASSIRIGNSLDLLDHLFVIERGVVEARPADPLRRDNAAVGEPS